MERGERRNRVYLDNNATTPVLPEALEAMCQTAGDSWGNPSAPYQEGAKAKKRLDWARTVFAESLKVPIDSIYFTSCGTESNNIIIRSVMASCGRGRDTIVTSNVEHASIRKTADSCGYKHIMVPVDRHGYVDEDAFRRILQSNAKSIGLVSVILGQNEVGTIQKIGRLTNIKREILPDSVPFHTDATQMLGKYYIEPDRLGVDLLTGSGHKFHGPRGVGILYAREGFLKPYTTPMTGGGQERSCRAGTENVPAIVGAAVAYQHALKSPSSWERRRGRIKEMRDGMLATLVRHVPGLVINGDPQNGLYNTLSVSFPGGHAHAIIKYMDDHGISVGGGSACSKGKPSESLLAMLGSSETANSIAHGTIRISLSRFNTSSQCSYATDMLIRAWRITTEMAKQASQ